ncbi:MAG TPA: hypothetical protein VFT71_05370 [Candidatus Nitrosocosmicus sp.]|jgi:hypothetical protein|nr:hypothetical protein [Candidatus Nitrosocosmicus sp.]
MSELKDDAFIIDSNKQFRIRVDGYLRGLGVYQIIGTREYLEVVFIGGEFSVKVGYQNKLEKLFDTVKKKLLEQTEFDIKEISSISYFIIEYTDDIRSILREIN